MQLLTARHGPQIPLQSHEILLQSRRLHRHWPDKPRLIPLPLPPAAIARSSDVPDAALLVAASSRLPALLVAELTLTRRPFRCSAHRRRHRTWSASSVTDVSRAPAPKRVCPFSVTDVKYHDLECQIFLSNSILDLGHAWSLPVLELHRTSPLPTLATGAPSPAAPASNALRNMPQLCRGMYPQPQSSGGAGRCRPPHARRRRLYSSYVGRRRPACLMHKTALLRTCFLQ
jgi:hypothetical protein